MVKSTIHNINVEHIKYKSTNAHINTIKTYNNTKLHIHTSM